MQKLVFPSALFVMFALAGCGAPVATQVPAQAPTQAAAPTQAPAPTAAPAPTKAPEVMPKATDAMVKAGDVMTKPADAMVKAGDVMTKPADAMVKAGDVMTKPADAMVKAGDVMTKPADAMVKAGDVMTKPADAMVKEPAMMVLGSGAFYNLGYKGGGQAKLVKQDGKTALQLDGFSVDSGPDLFVWLVTGDPVAKNGAAVIQNGVQLGKLQALTGNQTYSVPDGTDLTKFKSVVIWCKAFNVSFIAAPLKAS